MSSQASVTRQCRYCGKTFSTRDRRAKCSACRTKTQPGLISRCPTCGGLKSHRAKNCDACRHGVDPVLAPMAPWDLGWLVGIIEAEGTFVNGKVSHIRVQMTDEDTIQRLQSITGIGKVTSYVPQNPRHKASWLWTVKRKSNKAQLIDIIYPHLSSRRQQAARKLHQPSQNTGPLTNQDDFLNGWICGYIEGEGSICVYAYDQKVRDRVISVTSKDLEPIQTLHETLGGNIYRIQPRKEHWSPTSRWVVTKKTDILKVLDILHGKMSDRRTAACERMLESITLDQKP